MARYYCPPPDPVVVTWQSIEKAVYELREKGYDVNASVDIKRGLEEYHTRWPQPPLAEETK